MKKHSRLPSKLSAINYFDTGANYTDSTSNYLPAADAARSEMDRPFGISVIAFFYLSLGLGLFGLYFLKPNSLYSILNIPDASVFYSVYINFFSVFYILSAMLLWVGNKFGWILGVQSVLNTVFLQINSIRLPRQLLEQMHADTFRLENYFVDYSLHISLSALFILYYFNSGVVKFFKLDKITAAMIFLMIICFALVLHVSIFSFEPLNYQ
jgi:hypothetical protein